MGLNVDDVGLGEGTDIGLLILPMSLEDCNGILYYNNHVSANSMNTVIPARGLCMLSECIK